MCIPVNRLLEKVSFKSAWNSNLTLLVCCKVKLLYVTFCLINFLQNSFAVIIWIHFAPKAPRQAYFFQVGSKSEFLLLTQSSCPNSRDICKLTAFHSTKNCISVLFRVTSSNEFKKVNSRGKPSLNRETSSMKDVTCKIYLCYVTNKLNIYVPDRFTSKPCLHTWGKILNSTFLHLLLLPARNWSQLNLFFFALTRQAYFSIALFMMKKTEIMMNSFLPSDQNVVDLKKNLLLKNTSFLVSEACLFVFIFYSI